MLQDARGAAVSEWVRRGEGERPPHRATVAQPKAPPPATVVQPKARHPATVAQPKAPHPATARGTGLPPHPATVAQRRAAEPAPQVIQPVIVLPPGKQMDLIIALAIYQ